MIILIGSQKGGCGKSTLATCISVELARRGDTLLVDADSQTTSSRWADDRAEAGIEPAVPAVAKLGKIRPALIDLDNRYEFIVVDAAGRDSQELRHAMTAADVLICPFRPSQADLDTAEKLSAIIEEAQTFNENLKPYALLTMCPTHAGNTEIAEGREYLKSYEGLTLLDCAVYDRKAFRDAMSLGKSVTEHTDPKAANEIKALVEQISNG